MKNKKIFIGCVLFVIIVIVGIFIYKNILNKKNTEKIEIKSADYSALENDISEAINNKDLIKAGSFFNVLKFSTNNGENGNKEKYNELKENLQILKDERKTELLKKVDSSYDDMTLTTTYDFKGLDKFTEKQTKKAMKNGEAVIVQPSIAKKDKADNTNFVINFILFKKDWIFFDEIIINVDGEISKLQNTSFEKATQVLGGGLIAEVGGTNLSRYPLFNALVEKIINGNEIKIRLVGKDVRGNVDFNLTQEDKEHIKDLYELYWCL